MSTMNTRPGTTRAATTRRWGRLGLFLKVTIQRIWPDTKSRWIEITDGSFYDNLAAQTLLRRQVAHLIVGDATLDTTWQYDYLYNLQKRAKATSGRRSNGARRFRRKTRASGIGGSGGS